jgi:hypothetical protein
VRQRAPRHAALHAQRRCLAVGLEVGVVAVDSAALGLAAGAAGAATAAGSAAEATAVAAAETAAGLAGAAAGAPLARLPVAPARRHWVSCSESALR